jgi:hypothetical protein
LPDVSPGALVNAPKETEPFEEGSSDVADYVCPRARARRHELVLWSHPGPCPRCGETMRRERETALWD